MKQYDDFEDLLGEALSEYREADARPGLKGRMLATVEADVRRQRGSWWRWAAIAAAAVVLVAIYVERPKQETPVAVKDAVPAVQQVPEDHENQQVVAAPRGNAEVKSAKPQHRAGYAEAKRMLSARATPSFPVPQPLSTDEQKLMQLARLHPAALVDLEKSKKDSEANQPIEISGLTIKPIEGERQ